MPCLCTANTLRLFVRTVAQVDLPQTARFTTSRQLQIERFGYKRESRYTSKSDEPYFTKTPKPAKSEEDDAFGQLSYIDAEDVVVDFSPEAIDAIATEAATEWVQDAPLNTTNTPGYDTPLKSLMRDIPGRKTYTPMGQTGAVVRKIQSENTVMEQIGDVVRKAKSESKGLKIHYSTEPDWENIDVRRQWLRAKREREKAEEAARKAERQAARDDWVPPPRQPWMIEKDKIKEKYPDGYQPLKRLSPDAIAGIRALHAQAPEQCTTEVLAVEFKVTPEAIRRILKSKWTPSPEEQTDREQRWLKRGERVWSRLADMGTKPPKQWREMGIGAGKPDWMQPRPERRERERERRDIPRPPLPALITTARRREARTTSGGNSLSDRII
ncbi:uncharacterized protein PAC_02651 [Phialocephala subalpina]|uniref:Required for respiratory growth protein 9, mitochondrial n=1 Tax=Phialocephala subalpina TaxID=576137 RepID=A0A1L7WJ24_9HELO|nr:uncharacterized protein PAC_02651 [Phialocephala subalpina]